MLKCTDALAITRLSGQSSVREGGGICVGDLTHLPPLLRPLLCPPGDISHPLGRKHFGEEINTTQPSHVLSHIFYFRTFENTQKCNDFEMIQALNNKIRKNNKIRSAWATAINSNFLSHNLSANTKANNYVQIFRRKQIVPIAGMKKNCMSHHIARTMHPL